MPTPLRFAQSQARIAHARGHGSEERAWLDMCALLERRESEGWASYTAEQERHAETTARLERLRDGVAHLHDVYAAAPNEPRCCSDCAANDISPELRRLLADTADPSERTHDAE